LGAIPFFICFGRHLHHMSCRVPADLRANDRRLIEPKWSE